MDRSEDKWKLTKFTVNIKIAFQIEEGSFPNFARSILYI